MWDEEELPCIAATKIDDGSHDTLHSLMFPVPQQCGRSLHPPRPQGRGELVFRMGGDSQNGGGISKFAPNGGGLAEICSEWGGEPTFLLFLSSPMWGGTEK